MTKTEIHRLGSSKNADEKSNQFCDEAYSLINPWFESALDKYRKTKLFRPFQCLGGTSNKHPWFVFGYQGKKSVILQIHIGDISGDRLIIEGYVAKNVIHFIPVSKSMLRVMRKGKARIIYRTNQYTLCNLNDWKGFSLSEKSNLISKFISRI